MIGWLLSALAWVLGKLFGNPSAQPAPVVEGEKLGAATEDVASATQSAKSEAAIAQAEAQAPSDQAGLVQSLKDGTF